MQPGIPTCKMYAVTIKISMTDHHHLVNRNTRGLFKHFWGNQYGKSGHLYSSLFKVLNDDV